MTDADKDEDGILLSVLEQRSEGKFTLDDW